MLDVVLALNCEYAWKIAAAVSAADVFVHVVVDGYKYCVDCFKGELNKFSFIDDG